MALPEILVPAVVPPYRSDAHTRKRGNLHANVPAGTGHGRKRPLRTGAPSFVTVAVRMNALAMQAHDAWFDSTLKVGTLPFAVRLFGFGTAAPQWWAATWQAPPKCDPVKGAWIVTGTLRLTGEPSLDGPVSTSAAVEFGAALWATAEALQESNAAVEFSFALGVVQQAAVEFEMLLLAVKNGADPSAVDFDKRWIWMRYPYAKGRTSDVNDTAEADQRSWMGI
jgi:hypothetical protein